MIDALYKFLGKLGFTDPLHPMVVHVPIGLVIGALIFLVVALIFKRRQLVLTARHLSILALIFVVPSILFGVLDWIHFYQAAPIPAIQIKIVLAAILTVLLVIGIVAGGKAKPSSALMLIIYILSFFAVVGLGYYGGGLVFGRGGDAAAPSAGSSRTAAAAPAAAPAGFDEGKKLFEANCAACHPGGANVIVATLPVKGSKRLASLGAFTSFVRSPAMPDGKEGSMPGFAEADLSAGQVKQLFAYASTVYK